MLLEEFDKDKKAILNPDAFFEPIKDYPETCLMFFPDDVFKKFVKKYKAKKIKFKDSDAGYKFKFNGKDFVVGHAPMGASACVMSMERFIKFGVKNFIYVGCCGCLDEALEECSIILPTSAIRDEGTSYHYLPVSDEIKLDTKCVKVLEDVMKKNNLHYAKGKTWTTDGFYRETKAKTQKRKEQGAITVEMECSALATVAKFRGVKFAQILYGADSLAKEEYDARSLNAVGKRSAERNYKIIPLVLECAVEIDKNFSK